MDFGEKVCKKIDFWIDKAVKKLKKVKKYVILYIEIQYKYCFINVYIVFLYMEKERVKCWH